MKESTSKLHRNDRSTQKGVRNVSTKVGKKQKETAGKKAAAKPDLAPA
ncbi:hypothetical protein [Paenibacillus timonensis]|nr:hypothetical protein [Paenibacillus timonensis]